MSFIYCHRSLYCIVLPSCSGNYIASEEIDKILEELLYQSDYNVLSSEDESINNDNVIVHNSNGASTDSEESESDSPKPETLNKSSNDCDVQKEGIACGASNSNGVMAK